MKAMRRGNGYYAVSRNRKEAAYVSTEKNMWHRHGSMRIIEEMKNEQVVIVIKDKDKLNILNKCCIKAKMCRNIYGNLENIKAARIMELWHVVDYIGLIKPMSKGCKRRLTNMSNIYMQEPATKGKVVMKTTFGDIELKLWAKETPKTCRNFIQLCVEGYWDDTIFHIIIKGFITQDGDPTGTGEGGKIHGEPFKEEFYTSLRFCRRDLIAGTNAGKMTMVPNISLFLVLHQICRINIQSLVELPVNLYIVSHFNLLSFGEKAEKDVEESVILNKKFSGKGKSTHDHSTHPKLSSRPAVEPPGLANKERKEGRSNDSENDDEVKPQEELEFVKKEKEAMKKRIKDTLRDIKEEPKNVQNYKTDDFEDDKGECIGNEKKLQTDAGSIVVSLQLCLHYEKHIRIKEVTRENACYAESRSEKEAAYVSTEKNVWHRHGNMRIIEEMENEQVKYLWELGKYESSKNNGAVARRGLYWANKAYVIRISTPDLQNKHTIFGRVTGISIYSMLKLDGALVDENDKPLYPPRLIKPIILNNPFSDIIPRIIVQECEEVKDSSETQTAEVKYKSYMFAEFSPGRISLCYEIFCYRNFNLLTFGEEAEEDVEKSSILNKKRASSNNSAECVSGCEIVLRNGTLSFLFPKLFFLIRLRSCCRGLIAMANAGEDNNGSQFLFTLGSQLDLQNKHSIFGYVTGETIYDMLELEEALVGENDRPLYAPKMIKAELLNNPFSDTIPRIIVQESEEVKNRNKVKIKYVCSIYP
ncbi:Peptidyl-prolyl cis-trans isomerase CWC27 like protein [Eufriesea mexicana]|uniref:Spliceosome-associated protein CWC27 homolog n=1 Tax=Eufriesea mexicana TaxID=516756 RepID=A0A310SAI6_9HYME|nr:Peptidyl-prolyl cis-trans isomerase CWC27 like protein [Eufriesea mexicana]